MRGVFVGSRLHALKLQGESGFIVYLIGLIAAASIFWFGLSGQTSFPLLHMGVGSVAFVVWFALRLKIVDRESSPYLSLPRAIGYWVWLTGEILKANFVVMRAAVRATPDIEPAMTHVQTRCKSNLARVTFANSITLTPGTVTIDINGDDLLVHALYASDLTPGAFDEMDRRASEAIDGKN